MSRSRQPVPAPSTRPVTPTSLDAAPPVWCRGCFVLLVLLLLVALPGAVAAQSATSIASPIAGDAPIPVELPRDDGPHDVATEWWYYTGHLLTPSGDRYGFQYVIFKAKRGDLLGYVGHFAVTDNPRARFAYDERIAAAAGVSRPGPGPDGGGFDLTLGDWRMSGANGEDELRAAMPGYAIDLALDPGKPAALHDGDGFIRYTADSASYYYSRTRMPISGTLTLDGEAVPVTGEAWMDHQWGDFQTYQEGGWDWYAIQLDDGRDIMLYVIRDPAGNPAIVDGSIVAADGSLTILDEGDFTVAGTDTWTSPETGTTYPSGWRATIPAQDLSLIITPSLPDQELDTRATTGVIYWEGEATVAGTSRGEPIAGLAYVELTGYAPIEQIPALREPEATPSN